MLKGMPNMRITLYIISILVNGAAIVVRPIANEWGDALQYIGGALAAFTGIVALSNVEKESTAQRITRKLQTGEIAVTTIPPCGVPVGGALCVLPSGHDGEHLPAGGSAD